MRRVLLLVNPAAGGGRGRQRVAALRASLSTLGQVEERFSRAPGDLTRWAGEAEVDDLVVAGGDGSLFEVVQGLMSRAQRPRLGILAVGTGNSFVRDVGLSQPEVAVARLLEGASRPIDVVELRCDEGPVFSINLVSLGFSAEAGELTNRRFKALGAAGYIAAVLGTLVHLSYPVVPLSLDGGDWDRRPAALLSFSNTQYTGGAMRMAPGADPADGQVDVIRVGALSRARFLRTFPRIFGGSHLGQPGIEAARAREVRFDLDQAVTMMIDGEVLTRRLRALVVRPGALEVAA